MIWWELAGIGLALFLIFVPVVVILCVPEDLARKWLYKIRKKKATGQ